MAALIGTAVLAAPASAHNSDWTVDCKSVSVHLTAYNAQVTNSVTLSVDGGAVLASDEAFGAGYDFTGALPDHTAPITVHLVVKAGDGTKYNRDEYKTAAPCEKPSSPPPSSSAPPPTTASATPTVSTAPPATTATTNAPVVQVTSTAPSPAAADLAETGGSSATPMIAGIAGAVVAAGAVLLFLNRRRGAGHR